MSQTAVLAAEGSVAGSFTKARQAALDARDLLSAIESGSRSVEGLFLMGARLAHAVRADRVERWIDWELRGYNPADSACHEMLDHTRRRLAEDTSRAVCDSIPVLEARIALLHEERRVLAASASSAAERAQIRRELARIIAVYSASMAVLHAFATHVLDSRAHLLPVEERRPVFMPSLREQPQLDTNGRSYASDTLVEEDEPDLSECIAALDAFSSDWEAETAAPVEESASPEPEDAPSDDELVEDGLDSDDVVVETEPEDAGDAAAMTADPEESLDSEHAPEPTADIAEPEPDAMPPAMSEMAALLGDDASELEVAAPDDSLSDVTVPDLETTDGPADTAEDLDTDLSESPADVADIEDDADALTDLLAEPESADDGPAVAEEPAEEQAPDAEAVETEIAIESDLQREAEADPVTEEVEPVLDSDLTTDLVEEQDVDGSDDGEAEESGDESDLPMALLAESDEADDSETPVEAAEPATEPDGAEQPEVSLEAEPPVPDTEEETAETVPGPDADAGAESVPANSEEPAAAADSDEILSDADIDAVLAATEVDIADIQPDPVVLEGQFAEADAEDDESEDEILEGLANLTVEDGNGDEDESEEDPPGMGTI